MFEFSIVRKYLIPRKKQLSVALIAAMSTAVISLVVWLVLVFLSVTSGIERGWLEKLTSLNGPLRITPTQAYFSSHYYLTDTVSARSNFTPKSIGQKAATAQTDPYDPISDPEIPLHWMPADRYADGSLKDPVKIAYGILNEKKLNFQDFEISGALLKLELMRNVSPLITVRGEESQSFLTQVSYLASFSDKNPNIQSLLIKPTIKDLNHLFFLTHYSPSSVTQDTPSFGKPTTKRGFQERIESLLSSIKIKELKTSMNLWRVPPSLLPEGDVFAASAYEKSGHVNHLILQKDAPGKLVKKGGTLFYNDVPVNAPIFLDDGITFKAELVPSSMEDAMQLRDLRFAVEGKLQGHTVEGEIAWDGVEIAAADVKTEFDSKPISSPFWSHRVKENLVLPMIASREKGVLLAKSFQDAGVMIGDRGYLSYPAATASSVQEQRLPVYIAGFYDPGIMSVGNKCILVHPSIARTINAAAQNQQFDKTISNGIQVWFQDIKQASQIKDELQLAFDQAGIGHYWKISTYQEYDFAKDLLLQFQSDKYLFTLIGVIILTVACCNIISLLVLLVNDKKREIGILQAMGASPKSIALIFGGCGAMMGILSSLIGTAAAVLTLHNLDSLVHLLSIIQGRDAFNAVFYGSSLPNQLSEQALIFVLIATPLLSLLAGLVPAIKACRLRPSSILRSE